MNDLSPPTDDRAIVAELQQLDPGCRPQQFANLMTGSQYLPIYALTRRHLAPGLRALDWGSGNGHFSYFLLRQGVTVEAFNLGSQINPLARQLAATFGPRYRMTIGADDEPVALPFPDGSFDLAYSVGVLEHVRETGGSEAASLAELHRVLQPGGRLICGMLPKRHSWIEFLARHAGAAERHRHQFRYTGRELRQLVEAAGFRLLELASHGFLPRNSLQHRWLAPVHNRWPVANGFNGLDRLLARAAGPLAQNFLLAAEKQP